MIENFHKPRLSKPVYQQKQSLTVDFQIISSTFQTKEHGVAQDSKIVPVVDENSGMDAGAALRPGRPAQSGQWPADLTMLWSAQPNDSLRWEAFFAYLDTSRLDAGQKIDLVSQALEPIHQAGLRRSEGLALQQLGSLNLEQGDYERASRNLLSALQVFQSAADSTLMAGVYTNLGSLNYYQQVYPVAIQYWKYATGFYERRPNPLKLSVNYSNLGAAYSELNMLDSARWFHREALEQAGLSGDAAQIAAAYQNLGVTAEAAGRLSEALQHFQNAQGILDSLHDLPGLVRSYLNIGNLLEANRRFREAYEMNRKALALIPEANNPAYYRTVYLNLANLAHKLGEYKEAFEFLQKHQIYKDSILNEENNRTIQALQTQFEAEKEARENSLGPTPGDHRSLSVKLGSQGQWILIILLAALLGALAWAILGNRRRTGELLSAYLPPALARELQTTGRVAARRHDSVSVLFADLLGFTTHRPDLAPEVLVALIDRYYQTFDHILEKHGVEKVKSIGDAYMCAAGWPDPRPDHALALTRVALEMQEWIERQRGLGDEARVWQIRIGIHSGPVVSGMAGVRKYDYDLWGQTVHTATEIARSGLAGRINVSEATARPIAGHFFLEPQPPREIGGIGPVAIYQIKGRRLKEQENKG